MIQIEEQGKIAVLRLRHGKANTMDLELCRALTASLDEVQSSQCSAAVITGQGTIFSAGVDLLRVVDGGVEYVEEFLPALTECLVRLFTHSRPVVAAVNGHAVAGGCLLACASDHRLMADGKGRIGVPELLVGVPFPAVAMEIMRFVVSPGLLQKLLLGGERLLPGDALAAGLVDELVAPDRLLDSALAVAERLSRVPGPVFEVTKAQLRRPVVERIREAACDYSVQVKVLWTRPDTREAIRRYVEQTLGKG